jgi:hypothetical protein
LMLRFFFLRRCHMMMVNVYFESHWFFNYWQGHDVVDYCTQKPGDASTRPSWFFRKKNGSQDQGDCLSLQALIAASLRGT